MKWILVLGALFALGGCSGKAGQCGSNSDCPTGQLCLVDRRCQAPPAPPPPPAPVEVALSVAKTGDGSGAVRSEPAGIDCGNSCTYGFLAGSKLRLSANPAARSSFAGWSGACSGTGTCELTLSGPQLAIANFNRSAAASSPAPCMSQCRDIARACKGRCKIQHPHYGQPRHQCLLSCEVRENECRSRARC